MVKLIEQLQQADLTNRVFNERQLGAVLGGSDARRYGKVNRALKEGWLIRIKRGLYTVPRKYRSTPLHPFAVAQALLPGSYVSFETALSYHGWIPEAVHITASVSPARKTLSYDGGSLGQFSFSPVATEPYQFLVGIERRKLGDLTAFIASPLRALMDLVALRKETWQGLSWVTDGLRIDVNELSALTEKDFAELRPVYKHQNARLFLNALEVHVLPASAGVGENGL